MSKVESVCQLTHFIVLILLRVSHVYSMCAPSVCNTRENGVGGFFKFFFLKQHFIIIIIIIVSKRVCKILPMRILPRRRFCLAGISRVDRQTVLSYINTSFTVIIIFITMIDHNILLSPRTRQSRLSAHTLFMSKFIPLGPEATLPLKFL